MAKVYNPRRRTAEFSNAGSSLGQLTWIGSCAEIFDDLGNAVDAGGLIEVASGIQERSSSLQPSRISFRFSFGPANPGGWSWKTLRASGGGTVSRSLSVEAVWERSPRRPWPPGEKGDRRLQLSAAKPVI